MSQNDGASNRRLMKDKNVRAQVLSGIDRYAEADRSDPFAARRAYAHMRTGLVSAGDYDADRSTEMRAIRSQVTGRIEEYKAPVSINVKRG